MYSISISQYLILVFRQFRKFNKRIRIILILCTTVTLNNNLSTLIQDRCVNQTLVKLVNVSKKQVVTYAYVHRVLKCAHMVSTTAVCINKQPEQIKYYL